jgi:hypothetical protein
MKKFSVGWGGWGLLVIGLMVALLSFDCSAEEVKRISREELRGMLGRPDLQIVDVRLRSQWENDFQKIKGATREEPDQVAQWMGKYSKESTLVFYCT